MPNPDLTFAIRSLETSSISLHRQMADPEKRGAANAKLQEALENHQRTLARLMRTSPLQELGLALAMGGEIGKLQKMAESSDFGPDSKDWLQSSGKWQQLQRLALEELADVAEKKPADMNAKKKAFGLALLASVMALFLDEKAPMLSALLQEDRYKTALSDLTMEQMA